MGIDVFDKINQNKCVVQYSERLIFESYEIICKASLNIVHMKHDFFVNQIYSNFSEIFFIRYEYIFQPLKQPFLFTK